MNCTQCGHPLRSGIRCCTHCGTVIPAPLDEGRSDATPDPIPGNQAPPSGPWALAVVLVASWFGRSVFEHSAGAVLVVGFAIAAVEHDRDALAALLSGLVRWEVLRPLRQVLAGIPLSARLPIASVASCLAGFVATPVFSAIFSGFGFLVGFGTIAVSTVVAAFVLDPHSGGDGGA